MTAHNNKNVTEAVERFSFTSEALACIEETDADPLEDLQKMRDGRITQEGLLVACLEGDDADRVQGWRDYVSEVARVSRERGAP